MKVFCDNFQQLNFTSTLFLRFIFTKVSGKINVNKAMRYFPARTKIVGFSLTRNDGTSQYPLARSQQDLGGVCELNKISSKVVYQEGWGAGQALGTGG